mmetsp:Transcript_1580/g.2091  ORF Transcript_1580/g.2091 Transcript_1580/m.2091 type:complete len:138 (-) Transcript_1580:143-556(-)
MLEYVVYTLEKIEQQCDLQINALDGSICNIKSEAPSPAQLNFELAFHQFMLAYGKMDADTRANKIRKLFGCMSIRDQEQSSHFGAQLEESLSKCVKLADCFVPSFYCKNATCPYRVEFEKFNTLYDDFFPGPEFIEE